MDEVINEIKIITKVDSKISGIISDLAQELERKGYNFKGNQSNFYLSILDHGDCYGLSGMGLNLFIKKEDTECKKDT